MISLRNSVKLISFPFLLYNNINCFTQKHLQTVLSDLFINLFYFLKGKNAGTVLFKYYIVISKYEKEPGIKVFKKKLREVVSQMNNPELIK